MTPEQLQKANELTKKIESGRKHLNFMKDALKSSIDNKVPISLFSIKFDGGVGNQKNIEFTPNWLLDKDVKNNALEYLNVSAATLIELFESDLAIMEKELQSL